MAFDIRPLTPDDLPELARYLAGGFRAPPGAPFAGADVLAWKYFDPLGGDAGPAPRSLLARDPGGTIVGHVGVCPGRFRGPGLPPEGVSTLHMIDWLSSGGAAGAALMRRAHREAETQHVLGASAAARAVVGRAGYALVGPVPVYRKVLRPGHRLRADGPGPLGRWLRAARDAAGLALRRGRTPRASVALEPVAAFGPEVVPVLAACAGRAASTSRGPGPLNHALRYPRGGVTGWRVLRDGAFCGFAVLAAVPRGRVTEGRVVECLLADPDADAWHAAVHALTAELAGQGADLATGFAANAWSARAFRSAGYAPTHALEFRLRDRGGRVPPGVPFHLSPLDADYATTQ